jgi:ankyrin repeat-rich membrane spanning protein
MSCIIWAAGRGFVHIVEMLLEKGAKVNTTDKYGTSPLVWAARKGHLEIVHILLHHGGSVDIAGMVSRSCGICHLCDGGLEEFSYLRFPPIPV